MNRSFSMVVTAFFLAVAFAAGICVASPTNASAAYADETSYVDQGVCPKAHNGGHFAPHHAAINVIDDDGTVYTFEYHIQWHSDASSYRIYGQSQWHGWPEPDSGVPFTYLDHIALVGFQAVIRLTPQP